MVVPSGTEAARAFIPAKDFDSSKAFYEALGFKKLLDGDVAIFGVGATAFIVRAANICRSSFILLHVSRHLKAG